MLISFKNTHTHTHVPNTQLCSSHVETCYLRYSNKHIFCIMNTLNMCPMLGKVSWRLGGLWVWVLVGELAMEERLSFGRINGSQINIQAASYLHKKTSQTTLGFVLSLMKTTHVGWKIGLEMSSSLMKQTPSLVCL